MLKIWEWFIVPVQLPDFELSSYPSNVWIFRDNFFPCWFSISIQLIFAAFARWYWIGCWWKCQLNCPCLARQAAICISLQKSQQCCNRKTSIGRCCFFFQYWRCWCSPACPASKNSWQSCLLYLLLEHWQAKVWNQRTLSCFHSFLLAKLQQTLDLFGSASMLIGNNC